MSFQDHEKDCEQIREQNEKLLDDFYEWLDNKGLSEKTCDRHAGNVDFYLNEYLLYDEAIPADQGPGRVSMYFSYWFIKKGYWTSPSALKQHAGSLKKFYQFMLETSKVSEEDLSSMNETIKANMADWLATAARYDDPEIEDMDEVWGF